jgi:hypothetical protein
VLYAPSCGKLRFGEVAARALHAREGGWDLHNLLGVFTLTWAFVVRQRTGVINNLGRPAGALLAGRTA